ncbi:MAG: alcohol dehydrogenase [Deltaproteobacteria bacterium]|nr:alcohol dehydrogenase [Deltaproteobacteria bacterium]
MKAWRVVRHGRPTEALELLGVPEPSPGPGEVRVRVAATACNYNEVDGCYGRYRTVDPALPYTLGMEAVGIVDAAGEGAHAWLGRRVIATGVGATGAHAELALAQQDMVFDCPGSLSDIEAAAFYFPFHVAWVSLIERGRLVEGEALLVHAGAGGVGSAAIQLGVARGARVIATAGSEEKLEFCRKLGADLAIDYRSDEGFAGAVLDATGGRGVDVACDLVGGDVTAQTMGCMAYGGRLMMTGFSGGIGAEDESGLLPRPVLLGNFSLSGVLMTYGDPEKFAGTPINVVPRETGERIQAMLVDLLEAGQIRPVVGRSVPHERLPEELERMERRETMGRTVLDWKGVTA